MKMNLKFHFSVFIAVAMIFSVPFVTIAQQNSGRGGAEVAAAEDAQAVVLRAKAAAERDVNSDFNVRRFQWSIGGPAFVTLSSIWGAFLGCAVGNALNPPRQSDPFVDELNFGCTFFSTGMIYGCLGGWGTGFTASTYGIYKLGSAVPSERLIGKSPEYIEVYTKTYKRKIGLQRAVSAAVGSAMLHGMLFMWMSRTF